MKFALAMVVILFGGFCWVGAQAQVYECTAANGRVSFQDHACKKSQRQKILDVPSRPPPGYVPPPAATAPAAPPSSRVRAEPRRPSLLPLPLPALYACVGAVNGKHYLTRSPPPPYLAPLGVMGYPPQSLAEAYGPGHDGALPGSGQLPVSGSPVGSGMTEVHDYCLPAPRAEVCRFVRKEYEKNHRKLRMAMRHAQPPLEAREKRLSGQLKNC